MTDLLTPRPTRPNDGPESDSPLVRLIGRISRLEIIVGAVIAAILLVLVVLEPDILEAPFENANTMLFTVGGTVLAGAALVAMLWFRVPPPVRVVVLVVPFAIVNWWLLSPYFIDDVVDEEFSTSISAAAGLGAPAPAADPGSTDGGADGAADSANPGAADAMDDTEETAQDTDTAATQGDTAGDSSTSPEDNSAPTEDTSAPADAAAAPDAATTEETTEAPEAVEPPAPTGPVLLGAGQFVGLAGHFGTGDAGIFQNPDGTLVLRFENFDIQNGPDLEVYLVPGADQVSLAEGSIHLGALKGNIGDQNYELPAGTELAPGTYTALVWCEAFSVEFVGATISV